MGGQSPETERSNILRIVLSAVVDLAGVLVAFWRVHRRITRHKGRPAPSVDGDENRGVASPISGPGDFPLTHCIYCGRTAADVRALGCGGTDRKGQCLARTL